MLKKQFQQMYLRNIRDEKPQSKFLDKVKNNYPSPKRHFAPKIKKKVSIAPQTSKEFLK